MRPKKHDAPSQGGGKSHDAEDKPAVPPEESEKENVPGEEGDEGLERSDDDE